MISIESIDEQLGDVHLDLGQRQARAPMMTMKKKQLRWLVYYALRTLTIG